MLPFNFKNYINMATNTNLIIEAPVVPDHFRDPMTLDVLIEPVNTNCPAPPGNQDFEGHVFERLALAHYFRQTPGQTCPLCRHHVTAVTNDNALAERIQNEFVRTNGRINPQNEEYFNSVRNELQRTYGHLASQPVIPPRQPPRENFDPYRMQPYTQFVENPSTIRRITFRSPNYINRMWKNFINFITNFFNTILFRPNNYFLRVRQCILNGNLSRAFEIAQRLPSSKLRDLSYFEIVCAVFRGGYKIENFNEVLRVINLIDNISIKNFLYASIVKVHALNENYSLAIKTMKNIPSIAKKTWLFFVIGCFVFINLICAIFSRNTRSS